jgi:hypothetical protein
MVVMARAALAGLGLWCGVVATPAVAASVVDGLLPHRAVYDLKLSPRSTGTAVAAVSGRMVYEFNGSACDGFTTQFRFVTDMRDGEGKGRITDLRTSSFEDGKGTTLDFLNQTLIDQTQTDDAKGTATRGAGGLTVALSRPAKRELSVKADALFPTQHVAKVIETALAGGALFQAPIFDGSGDGQKLYQTTAVIGRPVATHDLSNEPAADAPALKDVAAWPVTISYFEDKGAPVGEGTPDYAVSMTLYQNGVSRRLTLDYGDFAIQATLAEFKPFERKPCP